MGSQLLQLEFMQVNSGGEGVQLVEVHGAGVPGAAGAAACQVGFACGLGAVEMFGQAVDDAPRSISWATWIVLCMTVACSSVAVPARICAKHSRTGSMIEAISLLVSLVPW